MEMTDKLASKIKCPRCGSTNTARILYGKPLMSEELEAKINAGELRLGGCCLTGADPKRYCNACKKAFGETAQILKNGEIEQYVDAVTEIVFYRLVEEAFLRSPWIKITKTTDGAQVETNGVVEQVKTSGVISYVPFENEYDVSKQNWNALVDALYNKLFLHNWEHHFVPPENVLVLDGESWDLTVKLTGERTHTYKGDNGYPPYWKEFEKLMKPYLPAECDFTMESLWQ